MKFVLSALREIYSQGWAKAVQAYWPFPKLHNSICGHSYDQALTII